MKTIIYIIQKGILSTVASIFLTTVSWSQAPESMSYQAVIRDANQKLVASKKVGVQISILKDKADGTAVFVETHTPTTNANGLVSLDIGTGKVVKGKFTDITWGASKYFLKTETDPKGGTDYSITSTSQLLSVPYALYANTSGSSTPGPKGDPGPKGPKGDPGPQGPLGGFKHHIGQEKDGGIIYHLYMGGDGKEHGLIVHKNESSPLKWQTTNSVTGATSTYDGKANTNKMTNSPAKAYVTGLGSGWYIPSLDEIILLQDSRFIINKALSKPGSKILSNNTYWSSTERGNDTAFGYGFGENSSFDYDKSQESSFRVRAVRVF